MSDIVEDEANANKRSLGQGTQHTEHRGSLVPNTSPNQNVGVSGTTPRSRRRSYVIGMQAATESIKERQVRINIHRVSAVFSTRGLTFLQYICFIT